MTRSLVVTSIAVMVLAIASVAPAATLEDAANGSWDLPATWGDAGVPATGDTLNIDQFTVSINKTLGATLTGAYTINLSGDGVDTDGKVFLNYDTNIAGSAVLNFNGGGTFENSRGQMFYGGVTMNVTGTNTYYTNSSGEISHVGNTTSVANALVITGNGTINKTGIGTLELRSIVNVLDADSGTPGNQPRVNASTFTGTWDVQAGKLELVVPEFTKFATVNLVGTVAGTIVGTNMDDSPYLSFGSNGGTYSGTQMEVKNLTGTGRISWNSTSGYYRDIAVGTLLDPGTASSAGLIMRNTSGGSNDLVLRPGATVAMDVFGATAADADQIVWKSSTGTSGMVFNEANLQVRLFTPTESLAATSWVLVDGDEWISKSTQGSGTAVAIADQKFANDVADSLVPMFYAADGSAIDLWDGTATDSGWTGLGLTYGGTMGNSDRQVILSGSYVYYNAPTVKMGDADGDTFVDDDDLSLLLSNWKGGNVGWSKGDFNASGDVDDDDLSLLLSNWTGSGGGTIPEPATIGLLILGGIGLISRRRRHQA